MNISASQIESIVRSVLGQMGGAAPAAAGPLPKTAKVAMLTAPKKIEVKEYPIPELGDDDILVRVEGCGVCGTDVHEWKGDPFGLIPVTLGHEGTGEIVALGKNIKADTAGTYNVGFGSTFGTSTTDTTNAALCSQGLTVEGTKDSHKCFLTIHFVNYHFMLIFLLESKTSSEVVRVFNWIQKQVGIKTFKELFPVILTDRGSEFIDPIGIEFDVETSEQRTHLFYCDAYVSSQKGAIESNHRKLRYIVPKGTNTDCFEEKHAILMTNHIASYPIRDLSGNTPYQIMEIVYGKETLTLLKVEKVDPSTVNLTPKLLMK